MSAAAIEALVILAAKYGPEFVVAIVGVFKKKDPTLADIEALFTNVKAYDAYGIKPPAV